MESYLQKTKEAQLSQTDRAMLRAIECLVN